MRGGPKDPNAPVGTETPQGFASAHQSRSEQGADRGDPARRPTRLRSRLARRTRRYARAADALRAVTLSIGLGIGLGVQFGLQHPLVPDLARPAAARPAEPEPEPDPGPAANPEAPADERPATLRRNDPRARAAAANANAQANAPARSSLTLSARSVEHWEDAGARWILLEGAASALRTPGQAPDDADERRVEAERIVVRLRHAPRTPADPREAVRAEIWADRPAPNTNANPNANAEHDDRNPNPAAAAAADLETDAREVWIVRGDILTQPTGRAETAKHRGRPLARVDRFPVLAAWDRLFPENPPPAPPRVRLNTPRPLDAEDPAIAPARAASSQPPSFDTVPPPRRVAEMIQPPGASRPESLPEPASIPELAPAPDQPPRTAPARPRPIDETAPAPVLDPAAPAPLETQDTVPRPPAIPGAGADRAPGDLPSPLPGIDLPDVPRIDPLQPPPGRRNDDPLAPEPERIPGLETPGLQPDDAPLPPDVRPLDVVVNDSPSDGPAPAAPVVIDERSKIRILPRSSRSKQIDSRYDPATRTSTIVWEGGVHVVAPTTDVNGNTRGLVDLAADRAVVWVNADVEKLKSGGMQGQDVSDLDSELNVEIYLEGNVYFRQDERKLLGPGDSRVARADVAPPQVKTERFVMFNAEIDQFGPGFIQPVKIRGLEIEQVRDPIFAPDGKRELGYRRVVARDTLTTGSQFADPGYHFDSSQTILQQIPDNDFPEPVPDPRDPTRLVMPEPEPVWRLDSRDNTFFIGPVPFFYWPRILADLDDVDPPLRNINLRTDRVFGTQVLTDWNVFRLFGARRPNNIVDWNLDLDFMSRRGFAVGTELTWYGAQLDAAGLGGYFGYLDAWGLADGANDILGPGPAIITNPPQYFVLNPFQRENVPAFQSARGRVLLRHMQSLLPREEAGNSLDDFRLQLEAAYVSDRNFLEQYYQRLFYAGLDQATLAYLIYQRRNDAFTALVEGNFQDWYTETQWLPKLDYYRFADLPFSDALGLELGNLFTYYGNTGVNFASTHTASEVNNPLLFPLPDGSRAFLPYDPVSNTASTFTAARAYTSHEIDLPINLDFVRLVPYAQGQLVGWSEQLDGDPMGRAWGALGARAQISAWRAFPEIRSELFDLEGLAHKASLSADLRSAYTNQSIYRVAVQDDLDDNTYEFVRRYFNLLNYPLGNPPPQIDPRLLVIRRGLSPVTGSTDLQERVDTLRLALNQRWQTKRGPEDDLRIVDFMTLNLAGTYFPNPRRDNFGESVGQLMYDYRWWLGDRTSVTSSGWFELYDVDGARRSLANYDTGGQGISVVDAAFQIQRPAKGGLSLGGTFIDVGSVMQTSVVYASTTYYMSPKWFLAASVSYDLSNDLLFGSTLSLTRIGADFLTTAGLAIDPQRNNYSFAFEVAPRLNARMQLGSGSAISRLGPILPYAPTQ